MQFYTYDNTPLIYIPYSNQIFPFDSVSEKLSRLIFKDVVLPYSFEMLKKQAETRISYLILGCTEACNMRCSYCIHNGCYPGVRRHSSASMSYETGLKAIDWLGEHSLLSDKIIIGFFGGEPLLEFDKIRRWCEYAEKKIGKERLLFNISTNGLLLNTNVIEWATDRPYIHFDITLNGPSEIHDQRRRTVTGEMTYHKIDSNVKQLFKKLGQSIEDRVLFLANYANFQEKKILQIWLDKNSVFRNITYLMPIFYPDDVYNNEAEDDKLLKTARQEFINNLSGSDIPPLLIHQRDFLEFIHNREISRTSTVVHPGLCTPLLSRVYVDVNGHFFLCERTEDFLSIGDLNSGIDWKKIRNVLCNDLYDLLNAELKCRQCPAVRMCRLCASVFLSKDGISQNILVLQKNCSRMRILLKNELEFYSTIMSRSKLAAQRYFKK